MKKLFLIVAAMFAVVSFSACSDDDDNKAPDLYTSGLKIYTTIDTRMQNVADYLL